MMETADGTLVCLTGGPDDAGAAAVVLVHGIQGTAAIWRQVMPMLSQDRRVLAPHLRGRSGSFSPKMPEAYDMASFAGDLHAVIATLRGPALLVGWSMGSLVALEYVQNYGTIGLAGLALVSGTPCIAATGSEDAAWFTGDTVEAVTLEAADRARRLNLVETATDVAVAGSWMSARTADYRAMLPRIDLPVLVLHGSDDPECPVSHAEIMAQAIPGAKLSVWQGCGHVPMSYAPQRFADELGSFVGACEFVQGLNAAAT